MPTINTVPDTYFIGQRIDADGTKNPAGEYIVTGRAPVDGSTPVLFIDCFVEATATSEDNTESQVEIIDSASGTTFVVDETSKLFQKVIVTTQSVTITPTNRNEFNFKVVDNSVGKVNSATITNLSSGDHVLKDGDCLQVAKLPAPATNFEAT